MKDVIKLMTVFLLLSCSNNELENGLYISDGSISIEVSNNAIRLLPDYLHKINIVRDTIKISSLNGRNSYILQNKDNIYFEQIKGESNYLDKKEFTLLENLPDIPWDSIVINAFININGENISFKYRIHLSKNGIAQLFGSNGSFLQNYNVNTMPFGKELLHEFDKISTDNFKLYRNVEDYLVKFYITKYTKNDILEFEGKEFPVTWPAIYSFYEFFINDTNKRNGIERILNN